MAKAIHMMIRVLDETKSVDFYRQALGLEIADRFAFDDFTLVYMRTPASDFEVELTINHGRTEPYTHGSGYGHLAVTVDNVDAEHRRLTRKQQQIAGVPFGHEREPGVHGRVTGQLGTLLAVQLGDETVEIVRRFSHRPYSAATAVLDSKISFRLFE